MPNLLTGAFVGHEVDVEFHPNPTSFPQPPSLSHLKTVPHIHLVVATKPPQLIKASFTLYKDYDIIFSLILHSNKVT